MKLLLVALLSISASAASLNLKESSLKWTGAKVTGSKHFGKLSFTKASSIEVKDGKIQKGNFIVDMNSMTVDDLTGDWANKFIGHIKSGDFFEVKKYPTAKLVIKSADNNSVKANLTIKGKTNPITFKYKKSGNAFVGKMIFDRTKFDMKYNSGNFFKDLGDKVINDEVSVEFKLVSK